MELIFTSIIVFCASLVEATFGFGAGLIAIPLLSLFMDIKDSIQLFLIFQIFKGTMLIPGWRYIAWSQVKYISFFLPIGVSLGFLCFKLADFRWLGIALGFYLLGYVANQTFVHFTFRPRALTKKQGQAVTGVGSGFVMGLMGTGGPLMVTYLKSAGLKKNELRFSAIYLMFISNCMRIGFGIPTGYFNNHNVTLMFYCLPAYLVALAIGYKLPKFITDKHFGWCINALLVFSGISLLIKNF